MNINTRAQDSIPKPQTGDRFPDCVAMKLHLKESAATTLVTQSSLELGKANQPIQAQELDLSLTINFSGEQEIEIPGGVRLGLPGGRAKFGVRRGQLRFVFQNCSMPLEKVALCQPFKVSIVVEMQKSESGEVQGETTGKLGVKVGRGSSEKVTVEVPQVKKVGAEASLSWVFESYGDRTILEGSLQEQLLGSLCVSGLPCELTADFIVKGEDVCLTWGKIWQTQDIHRNKLAVIERVIALRYIKPIVEKEPVCQGRWQHG